MSNSNSIQKIKIQDIINDKETAIMQDQLKYLLNQPPQEDWIKTNKYANNSKYLPIDKVEYLLDILFQEWKIEILETKHIFSAVQVSIRLHYKNPVNGVWMFHDGVGACELQTTSGSGVLKPDFSNINKGAVEMAVPKAKSEAIKDASHHLGKLFGRDINRKGAISYKLIYEPKNDDRLRLQQYIKKSSNIEELEDIEIHISNDDKEMVVLYENKKKELASKLINQ